MRRDEELGAKVQVTILRRTILFFRHLECVEVLMTVKTKHPEQSSPTKATASLL